jgi:hypothetical protein
VIGALGRGRWLATTLALFAIPLLATACGSTSAEEASGEPAVTEQVAGTDIIRVKLTADAAERLGVETVQVRRDPTSSRAVIPYAAVLYARTAALDAQPGTSRFSGGTSPCSNPRRRRSAQQRTARRHRRGDAGATEIWGVEYGGIEED